MKLKGRAAASRTGGRSATTRVIPPKLALAVGMPSGPTPPGWKWSTLTDLARMESGHTPSRRHPEYWGGKIPWISIQDARDHHGGRISQTREPTNQLGVDNSSARILPKNTVCLSRTASVGYVVVMDRPMATSQDFVNWVCSDELEPDFLKYLFIAEGEDLLRFASGAVHPTIYFPEAKAFHICHPDVREQRRIVGTLDRALKAIDTATACTEGNLHRSSALFDSYRNTLLSDGKGARKEYRLSDVCQITSRLVDPRRTEFTDLPHVGAGNVVSNTGQLVDVKTAREERLKSGKFLFDESMVLYSKIRPYLKKVCRPDFVGLCSADVYPLAPDTSLLDKNFLFHLLLSDRFTEYAISGSARAGMPKVNRDHLFGYPLRLPSVREQQRVATRLDSVATEVSRLIEVYERKARHLAALRRAILNDALCGKLTARPVSAVVPFLRSVPGISTTDLHAGILARSYQRHEHAKRTQTFGHVKAEKIAHLVEAIAGIDLDRNPVKDAAGPNDYPHFHEVEHRAKKAGYFLFKKTATGGGYRLQKLRRFDELINRANSALADHGEAVDRVIELTLPMTSQQAEIVATVYAAWNNLLLDGCEITDEAIVREAREDWHPRKLDIPRDKFFKAIVWMKKKQLVPTGTGKRVESRDAHE